MLMTFIGWTSAPASRPGSAALGFPCFQSAAIHQQSELACGSCVSLGKCFALLELRCVHSQTNHGALQPFGRWPVFE
ncbi:hypothetical protein D3C85_1340480 [compost metagenome]